jgi:Protein of unknown function (DUF1549)/Protein of unknown function (DUF1553)
VPFIERLPHLTAAANVRRNVAGKMAMSISKSIRVFCIHLVGCSTVFFAWSSNLQADSRGDELAQWINQRGAEVWGKAPEKCDDLTFARRIYLDLLGRVPSVAELRDFEKLEGDRRQRLIEMLVFGEGDRADRYLRLSAEHLARQWRQVLLPNSSAMSAGGIENWLATQFKNDVPYDEFMRRLVRVQEANSTDSNMAGQQNYFQLLGGLPENYAGNISRVLLGVRIECAQCHDHPFTEWKQKDFWGLAAFYSDLKVVPGDATTSKAGTVGKIQFEDSEYVAKFLWNTDPLVQNTLALRTRLGEWITSKDNPNFSATAANRFWQHLVGRGLYPDIENLDVAKPEERRFADELGRRFANDAFNVRRLLAAICKSDWYQAESQPEAIDALAFYRPLKSVSPEQVFDSMEESLHLPVSRVDPTSPRYSSERMQLISRLSESSNRTPADYAAGIPQALMMMNGRLTNEAVNLESSRLLRSVAEAPFFETRDRVETLYLSVLTRRPTEEESKVINGFFEAQQDDVSRKRVMGELLWALLNSPEFVLCR